MYIEHVVQQDDKQYIAVNLTYFSPGLILVLFLRIQAFVNNIIFDANVRLCFYRAIPFEDRTPMEEGNSVTIPVEQTVKIKSSRKI